MGDLISREAARNAVYGYEMQTGIAEMPLEFAHNKIDEVPSVPAVPLDKLCEWLEHEASYNSCSRRIRADQWKYVLTKGMEEQDAAD